MLPLQRGTQITQGVNRIVSDLYGVRMQLDLNNLNTVCHNDCYMYKARLADVYLTPAVVDGNEVGLCGLIVGRTKEVFDLNKNTLVIKNIEGPSVYSKGFEANVGGNHPLVVVETEDERYMKLSKRAQVNFYPSGNIVKDITGFFIAPTNALFQEYFDEYGDRIAINGVIQTELPIVIGPFQGTIVRDITGF
jgi:hypothetical protein